jgi:modulator of FtsH protease
VVNVGCAERGRGIDHFRLTAYDPAEWSDLFVAAAGASATLAGLLFVAVSINIERILSYKGLPERALETLTLLLLVLLISILGLMPEQGHLAIGGEVLAISLVAAILVLRLPAGHPRGESEPSGWLITRWGSRAIAILPPLIGSLSLIAETGGGLYWVAVGFVFAISAAVANAWVLLVEILR